MRRASITEAKNKLSALLEEVRRGETVLITDRGEPVARLEPVRQSDLTDEERLARLERNGIIRRGKGMDREFLEEFDRMPRPKMPPGRGLLEALLEERQEDER